MKIAVAVSLLIQPLNGAIGDLLKQYPGHTAIVNDVAVSEDYIMSAGRDNLVIQWSRKDDTVLNQFTIPQTPTTIWIMNSSFLVSTNGGRVYRYFFNGTEMKMIQAQGAYSYAYVLPNREDLVFTCSTLPDPIVRLYNLTNGYFIGSWFINAQCRSLYVDPQLSFLLAAGNDGVVRHFNFSTGINYRNSTECLEFGVFDQSLYCSSGTGATGGLATERELSTDKIIRNFSWAGVLGFRGFVLYKGYLISGDAFGSIHIFNASSTQWLRSTRGHSLGVLALALYADALYTASSDFWVNKYDLSISNTLGSQISSTTKRDNVITLNLQDSGTGQSSVSTASFDSVSLRGDEQNQGSFGTNFFVVTAGITASITLLTLALILYVRSRRKRSKPIEARDVTSIQQHTTSMITDVTTLMTDHALSVPGFLISRYGLEYVVKDKIAQGGGGSIYTCIAVDGNVQQRSMGQPLVCKIVSNKPLSELSERFQLSFLQELSIMWQFRDTPNFPKLYAFSTEPVAMVLRYYNCGDLSDLIHGKINGVHYSKSLVVALLRLISITVMEMHKKGYAHCDLKPQNVLLDISNGTLVPVLIDFGISRVLEPKSLQVQAFHVADVRGLSISYAAPDVIRRFHNNIRETDPVIWKAGDIYALAMTLYELLLRKSPYY